MPRESRVESSRESSLYLSVDSRPRRAAAAVADGAGAGAAAATGHNSCGTALTY